MTDTVCSVGGWWDGMSLEVFSDLDSVILSGVIIGAVICANSVLLKSGRECGELSCLGWSREQGHKASEHIQQKNDLSSPNNVMQR